MTCIYQRQQIYTSVNHVIIIYAILCLPIGSPSGWRRKASKERLLFFMLKAENEKNLTPLTSELAKLELQILSVSLHPCC